MIVVISTMAILKPFFLVIWKLSVIIITANVAAGIIIYMNTYGSNDSVPTPIKGTESMNGIDPYRILLSSVVVNNANCIYPKDKYAPCGEVYPRNACVVINIAPTANAVSQIIDDLCSGVTLRISFVIKNIAVIAMILTKFNPMNNPNSMLLTIMVEMPGIEPGSNHKRHASKSTVY